MAALKFSLIIFFQLFVVACGGGAGEGGANTQHSEIKTPSYFVETTNRNNCAIDAVNKALGETFITPQAYEKYIMLIYAPKFEKTANDSECSKAAQASAFKSHYITEKQCQAFLKFYQSTKGEEARLSELEEEFNESMFVDASRMNFHEYKKHHGLLGEYKEILRVIEIVNKVYKLKLPIDLTQNNSSDFKDFESLIRYQSDHFFTLLKKNGDKFDSESQAQNVVGFTLADIKQAQKAFHADPDVFDKLFIAALQDPS